MARAGTRARGKVRPWPDGPIPWPRKPACPDRFLGQSLTFQNQASITDLSHFGTIPDLDKNSLKFDGLNDLCTEMR